MVLGFINVLSWATVSLLLAGRGMSDIRPGGTREGMGEGWSMGPMTPAMKALAIQRQGDFKYGIPWTTLVNYLDYLTEKGISPNVASFVGAGTVRVHVLGEGDVDPDAAQLGKMRALVHQAMPERSEERRGGKECCRTGRSRGWPDH